MNKFLFLIFLIFNSYSTIIPAGEEIIYKGAHLYFSSNHSEYRQYKEINMDCLNLTAGKVQRFKDDFISSKYPIIFNVINFHSFEHFEKFMPFMKNVVNLSIEEKSFIPLKIQSVWENHPECFQNLEYLSVSMHHFKVISSKGLPNLSHLILLRNLLDKEEVFIFNYEAPKVIYFEVKERHLDICGNTQDFLNGSKINNKDFIGIEGIKIIVNFFKNLETLNLTHQWVQAEGFELIMENLLCLKELFLSFSNIRTITFKTGFFLGKSSLKWLVLNENEIDEEGFKNLKVNENMRKLSLDKCNIDDSKLKIIYKNLKNTPDLSVFFGC